MRDARDLLSGSLHIERIVFSFERKHVYHGPVYREEKRTHCCIGAISGDRFLLVEIPSVETANEPVDLLQLRSPTLIARTSDNNFYYNGPLLAPQPRSASTPHLERAFEAQLQPLRECLQLGLFLVRQGSFRWEGERFSADYSDEMRDQPGRISVGFGPNVPQNAKEKFLAELENPPATRPPRTAKLVKSVHRSFSSEGKVIWSSDGNLEPQEISRPVPGSVEARIVAHYEAQHEAKMAKGATGQLVRDAQGNVSEIHLDQDPFRIELEYAPSPELPLPWPHRIRRILTQRTEPPTEPYEITIYAARISEHPLDDAVFIPWRYLKERTYVRGKVLPTGGFTVADPNDRDLLHDLLKRQRGR
jgi:hypothetical protein